MEENRKVFIPESIHNRAKITRIVYIFILLALFYRWTVHALPAQMLNPNLVFTNLDITYWIFFSSGFGRWLSDSETAIIIFQGMLIALPSLVLIFPLQRLFTITCSFLFLLYGIYFNAFNNSHNHLFAGIFLISLVFWWKSFNGFLLTWTAARYYTLFIYVAAFIWKIFMYGSFWHWNQGVVIMQSNLAEPMLNAPASFSTRFFSFLFRHPWIPNLGEKLLTLMEFFPVVGFFTRKFDKHIFTVILLIHIITSYFLKVFFFEYLPLWLTLLIRPESKGSGNFFSFSSEKK